jgi:hypothetical protein
VLALRGPRARENGSAGLPLPEKTQGAIREALKERTEGVRKIAARFGVDPSTVQRISVAMRPFGVSEGG